MEPLFEVVAHHTREHYYAMAKAKSSRHSAVVWVCLAFLAVDTAILWLLRIEWAVWCAVVLLVGLAYMIQRTRLYGKLLYYARNRAVECTTYRFGALDIGFFNAVEEGRIHYEDIVRLKEDARHLLIFVKKHTAIVVARSELEEIEGLKALLRDKTGLEIEAI